MSDIHFFGVRISIFSSTISLVFFWVNISKIIPKFHRAEGNISLKQKVLVTQKCFILLYLVKIIQPEATNPPAPSELIR